MWWARPTAVFCDILMKPILSPSEAPYTLCAWWRAEWVGVLPVGAGYRAEQPTRRTLTRGLSLEVIPPRSSWVFTSHWPRLKLIDMELSHYCQTGPCKAVPTRLLAVPAQQADIHSLKTCYSRVPQGKHWWISPVLFRNTVLTYWPVWLKERNNTHNMSKKKDYWHFLRVYDQLKQNLSKKQTMSVRKHEEINIGNNIMVSHTYRTTAVSTFWKWTNSLDFKLKTPDFPFSPSLIKKIIHAWLNNKTSPAMGRPLVKRKEDSIRQEVDSQASIGQRRSSRGRKRGGAVGCSEAGGEALTDTTEEKMSSAFSHKEHERRGKGATWSLRTHINSCPLGPHHSPIRSGLST